MAYNPCRTPSVMSMREPRALFLYLRRYIVMNIHLSSYIITDGLYLRRRYRVLSCQAPLRPATGYGPLRVRDCNQHNRGGAHVGEIQAGLQTDTRAHEKVNVFLLRLEP